MPNESINPQTATNAPQADETTTRVEEAAEHSKANEEAKRYRLKAKELKSQLEESSRTLKQAEEARDRAQAETSELRQTVEDLKYRTLVHQIKNMNTLFEQGAVPGIKDTAWRYYDKASYSRLVVQAKALDEWLKTPENLENITIGRRKGLSVDELLEVEPAQLNMAIANYISEHYEFMMKVLQPTQTQSGPHFTVREQTRTHALKSNLGNVYTMLDRAGFYF